MNYDSWRDAQLLYLVDSLKDLRKFSSPLVQGANVHRDSKGFLINVKRTCKGSQEFLFPLQNYFEKGEIFQVIGDSFNELTGDMGLIFEDGTFLEFVRRIDEGADVLGSTISQRKYFCRLTGPYAERQKNYMIGRR